MKEERTYHVVSHQYVLMMGIDTDHFGDFHYEVMKLEMYVEIMIVHYHLKYYHHLMSDHLDYSYYYFSFYSLISLFAIRHPMTKKTLR